MKRSSLDMLNEARKARRAAVHVTNLASGDDWVLDERGALDHPAAAEIDKALRSGKPAAVRTSDGELFINPQRPPAVIVVIGAVHISQALARIASLCDFDVRIVDPRTAFATAERFRDIEVLADWPVDAFETRPLDRYTALVAVTHDPKIDDWAIAEALAARCFYVGALGSRKTHASRLERLRALGLGDDNLSKIHAPIGLNIGAASPAEIAVAILAEIIQAARTTARGTAGVVE